MTPATRPHQGRIIVFGMLFWYPLAGVTYQFLHYLLGLRRLGYDVFYVEDSARWMYDPTIDDLTPEAGRNVAAIAPVLEAYGFEGRWAFNGSYPGGRCYGMTETDLRALYHEADAFLNVTGAQEIREEHLRVPRRIYVESDPFSMQVKIANGDQEILRQLSAHDAHFTFGENLGAADCHVPIERFRWQPTRQPIALDLWDSSLPAGRVYNTITTWRNDGKDVSYRGETYYWTKHREFEKLVDLPRRRPEASFEIAAGIGEDVRQLLLRNGWRHVDSLPISRDPARYRRYIEGSRGEFTVARDQYVRPNTGWFSDRSACYLAAGRPVITQETGFSKFVPSGKGLFAFRTREDVLAAVDAIEGDWSTHARAAREIAAEYFAAAKVVASLMQRAGL